MTHLRVVLTTMLVTLLTHQLIAQERLLLYARLRFKTHRYLEKIKIRKFKSVLEFQDRVRVILTKKQLAVGKQMVWRSDNETITWIL